MILFLITVICDIIKIKLVETDEYMVVIGGAVLLSDTDTPSVFERRAKENGTGAVSFGYDDLFLALDPSNGRLVSNSINFSHSQFMTVGIGDDRYKILNGDLCLTKDYNTVVAKECTKSGKQIFNVYGTISGDIHNMERSKHHHVHHHHGHEEDRCVGVYCEGHEDHKTYVEYPFWGEEGHHEGGHYIGDRHTYEDSHHHGEGHYIGEGHHGEGHPHGDWHHHTPEHHGEGHYLGVGHHNSHFNTPTQVGGFFDSH